MWSEYVHYEFSEFGDQWFGNPLDRPPIEKRLDSVYKVEVVGGRVQKLRDDATHLFVRWHLLFCPQLALALSVFTSHMACASLRFKAGGYSANCLEALSLPRLVSRQRPTSDS